jgi:hypothetical protein
MRKGIVMNVNGEERLRPVFHFTPTSRSWLN